MTFWLALRRLLPLLAVISLALAPVTAPAATVGMHAALSQGHPAVAGDREGGHAMMVGHAVAPDGMSDMAMDDMPCCPKAEAAKPDCAKGCPLMALCLASIVSLPPAGMVMPVPAATRASLSWPEPGAFPSWRGPPLPEPPRA